MQPRALFALFAACGGGHHHDAPDASPDAPPDASLNAVTVDLLGVTPDLIVYRDGDGPWQTAAATAVGKYAVHVSDAYQVLSVCDDPTNGPDVEVIARSFVSDGNAETIFCGFGPATATVHVSGRMLQAGQIRIGGSDSSTTAPWQFDIVAPVGAHELIAVGANNKMLIQRGLSITAPTTLPDVDVANATALVPIAHTVSGSTAQDTVSTHTVLFTAHEFASFGRADGTTALVAPAGALAADDQQSVNVTASDGNVERTAQYRTPGPTTLTLPPALVGVTFGSAQGDLVASFGALPPGDSLQLFAFGDTTGFQFLDASRAFADKTHATELTFDSSMPGFKPQWRIDLTQGHFSELTLIGHAGMVTTLSNVTDSAMVAKPARAIARCRGSASGARRTACR